MQEIFQIMGVPHRTTTAYNPRVDGLTERMNGLRAKAISYYVHINHKNQNEVIPWLHFLSVLCNEAQQNIRR